MFDWIKKKLLSSFLSNLARRGLGIGGGALVTAEILTAAEAATWEDLTLKVILGLAAIAFDLAWSYYEKKTLKASMPIK